MIDNGVIFSSSVIENAGSRVGEKAMIQAGTTFSKDVPPYSIVKSNATYGGVNTLICKNAGIEEKVLKHIANAYRLLFNGQVSVFDALNQIKEQIPDSEEIRKVITFISETEKGLIGKL